MFHVVLTRRSSLSKLVFPTLPSRIRFGNKREFETVLAKPKPTRHSHLTVTRTTRNCKSLKRNVNCAIGPKPNSKHVSKNQTSNITTHATSISSRRNAHVSSKHEKPANGQRVRGHVDHGHGAQRRVFWAVPAARVRHDDHRIGHTAKTQNGDEERCNVAAPGQNEQYHDDGARQRHCPYVVCQLWAVFHALCVCRKHTTAQER